MKISRENDVTILVYCLAQSNGYQLWTVGGDGGESSDGGDGGGVDHGGGYARDSGDEGGECGGGVDHGGGDGRDSGDEVLGLRLDPGDAENYKSQER